MEIDPNKGEAHLKRRERFGTGLPRVFSTDPETLNTLAAQTQEDIDKLYARGQRVISFSGIRLDSEIVDPSVSLRIAGRQRGLELLDRLLPPVE
jgi:hypothetical protein